jgi:hypothetical protein
MTIKDRELEVIDEDEEGGPEGTNISPSKVSNNISHSL